MRNARCNHRLRKHHRKLRYIWLLTFSHFRVTYIYIYIYAEIRIYGILAISISLRKQVFLHMKLDSDTCDRV